MNKVFTKNILFCIIYSESAFNNLRREKMRLKWEYDQEHSCFVSQNNVYCTKPVDINLQALNIFVPSVLMNLDGSINEEATVKTSSGKQYTSKTIPIIFYNDIGGYAECKPAMLTRRNKRYLNDGYVLVSVGARGRQSKNQDNFGIGKAPSGLVDLKAALRWLRKHKNEIPGNTDKIISVGTSAGGAMSSLLGSSGDNVDFEPYLEEIGAEMSTSDRVYASQCYCPIINLEYADMAYEWMFHTKKIFTFSSSQKPEVLSKEEQELSETLAKSFPNYLNQLELGEELEEDGRSGSFYQGVLESLSDSLNTFLDKQTDNLSEKQLLVKELDPSSLWTTWQDNRVLVTDLDAYVQHFIGRMKPCPAFDGLNKQMPENEFFGSRDISHHHFSKSLFKHLKSLSFSDNILREFKEDLSSDTQKRVALMNPMNFLNQQTISHSQQAAFFRICLGSKDADTSFAISRMLYLLLKKQGINVDYQLIWGMGHGDADYNEEFSHWVDKIVA